MDQQEYYLMMFEIRDELVSRVLDECHKKYIEKERIKYIVDCAHLSWTQIVDIHFYVHDRVSDFYGNNSVWHCDEDLAPCVADSWASGNVSLKPSSVAKLDVEPVKTAVMSDYQVIECFDYPTEHMFTIEDGLKLVDNVSDMCESDSGTKQVVEAYRSVQFTSFVSNNETQDDNGIEPVREKISDEFTKSLKTLRKKNLSVCGLKKKPQVSWFEIDRNVEQPHLMYFPLLRLNAVAQVKQASRSTKTKQSAVIEE